MTRHARTAARHARLSAPFSVIFALVAFGLDHVVPGAYLLLALFGAKMIGGTVFHWIGERHAHAPVPTFSACTCAHATDAS